MALLVAAGSVASASTRTDGPVTAQQVAGEILPGY